MENDVNKATHTMSGIAICLSNIGEGNSELAFYDVCAESATDDNRVWKQMAFYTQVAFTNERLDNMALSDEEFQRIGEAVVARLLALESRLK